MCSAPGSGPWYVGYVLGSLGKNCGKCKLHCSSDRGGGVKDRCATASTGMGTGIHIEGPCQVSPLLQSRLLQLQSCTFLCVDSCEAVLMVCYVLCPSYDERPHEAYTVSWDILMLCADCVAWRQPFWHDVLVFCLFGQTSTLLRFVTPCPPAHLCIHGRDMQAYLCQGPTFPLAGGWCSVTRSSWVE